MTGARPDFRADFSRQQPGRRLEASVKLETDVDDDSGKGGIITVDEEQRIMHFNQGAEQIFGWSAAEVAGRSLAGEVRAPDDDLAVRRLGGRCQTVITGTFQL